MLKNLIRPILRKRGLDIVRYRPEDQDSLSDLSQEERALIQAARPLSMTSASRMASLIGSVNYILQNNIPGDICECGVWRGGSMVIIARTLLTKGDATRSLYLYDTFEGMSEPTAEDVNNNGKTAEAFLREEPKGTGVWCHATLEDVRANLLATGYPADKIHFIKGKVEDTIPKTLPSTLALLRLDTDWYASTRHELEHLYPLLNPDGILIIDDYGAWQGARKAVDEYFAKSKRPILMHRIDDTGRLIKK